MEEYLNKRESKNLAPSTGSGPFLASPDAQEVIVVTESVSQSLTHSELADLTDVTLVSDDTFRRLY